MNEAINIGRLRSMAGMCNTGACPCSPGTCQLNSAILQFELEYGALPPSIESLRDEISARLADLEAACEADTDPNFFAKLQDNPVTCERRTEVRYRIAAAHIRLELATGKTIDAEMVDASLHGAGLLISKEAGEVARLGDYVTVMRSDLRQIGTIRGIEDVDDRTRLAVAWVEPR